MRRTTLALLCLACASGKGTGITADDRRLHLDAVVVDAHCDIAQAMFYEGYDLLSRHTAHHVDLPRLQEGGVDAEVFAIAVHPESVDLTQFFPTAMRQIDLLQQVARKSGGALQIARNADEVPDNADKGATSILLTHSAARALSNHPRNASDEMLQAVARNGGAVCVDFSRTFLDDRFRRATQALLQKTKGMLASEKMELYRRENLPEVRLDTLVDHIEHVARVAGNDHVCLGSDFDDAPMMPVGLEDASKYPAITAALRARGWTPRNIRKVLGENLLRVLAASEGR